MQQCIKNPEEVIYRKKAATAAAPAKPREPLRAPAPLKTGEEVAGETPAVPVATPLLLEGTWGTPPVGPWGIALPAGVLAETGTVE